VCVCVYGPLAARAKAAASANGGAVGVFPRKEESFSFKTKSVAGAGRGDFPSKEENRVVL
jgi:hypothetical protein